MNSFQKQAQQNSAMGNHASSLEVLDKFRTKNTITTLNSTSSGTVMQTTTIKAPQQPTAADSSNIQLNKKPSRDEELFARLMQHANSQNREASSGLDTEIVNLEAPSEMRGRSVMNFLKPANRGYPGNKTFA